MFDSDTWREIFAIMQKNKLRTMLTALSVAWGIFILIILLGVGKGLQNGAEIQFKGDAANSSWIFPDRTTVPYKGMAVNRQIQLKNSDYEALSQRIQGVEHLTVRYSPPTETSLVIAGAIAGFFPAWRAAKIRPIVALSA